MAGRIQYITSESVQRTLVLAFEASAASSLPVKRAFAETKRSEAPRLCHVATASRNQILRLFLRQRKEVLSKAEEAASALRKSMKTSLGSLAWELKPCLADLALAPSGSSAMDEFIAQHRDALKQEVQKRRAMARARVDRCVDPDMVITQHDWVQWFRKNHDAFYASMEAASELRRRANRRLHAASDMPPAVWQPPPARL